MSAIAWLLGPVLVVAAAIASLFVAEDAAHFNVFRGTIAVMLVVALVGLGSILELTAARRMTRHK